MKTRRDARRLGASLLLPLVLLGVATDVAAQPVVRDHRSPRDTGGVRGGVTVDVDLHGVAVGGGGGIVVGGDVVGGDVVVSGGAVAEDPDVRADVGVGVATGGEMVAGGGASYAGDVMDGDPLVAPHWEVAVGMLLPFELSSDGPTLAVQAGRQIGPLRLAVDYARYERPFPQAGICPYEASRLGLSARYRVSLGMGVAAFGAYVEGGLGREVARHHDMTATSPSVLVGAGVEAMFGERRSIGFDVGYRMHIDTATQASVSLLQLGMLLGGR